MWQRNYVVLSTGERVRYALLERRDAESSGYHVRFRDPAGKRVLRSTGQAKKPQAIEAAHRLILEEYQQVAPSAERMTWDAGKERLRDALEADGKRPATVKGYMETIDKLVGLLPFAKGPADVTSKMAEDFKTKYAKGKFVRKRDKEGAPEFPRKAKSLDSRLRTLKAVFTWFKKLRLVEGNPFEGVAQPELDRHEVKFVRETDVGEFFEWLEARYPGWRMPALFFTVKALTGCRLDDLCTIRSKQLQDGRLVFSAERTKNRSERYAVLPAEVFGELRAYAGKSYLWEGYPAELKAEIEKKQAPTHRLNPEFSPRRLYLWIVALMQDYQKETGSDLSSHDFRRAAFTRAAEDDIHPKRAAVAFDVTPETMMRYYTATEKKRTADDVLGGLASRLLPRGGQSR
jgi:integrase